MSIVLTLSQAKKSSNSSMTAVNGDDSEPVSKRFLGAARFKLDS